MNESRASATGGQSLSTSPERPSISGPSKRASRASVSGLVRKKSSIAYPDDMSTSSKPSLMGILAGKRFAKKISTRFHHRLSSSNTGSKSGISRIEPRLEPTYRLGPKHKFQATKVIDCIEDILEQRMKTFHYSPKMSTVMGRVLSEEVKQGVKSLCFDRYKIVVSVTIGEKKGQGLQCTSRCAWNEQHDNSATYTMQGQDFFCTVSVFGVYAE